MPWLSVNQTLLCWFSAVPAPVFALEVQRGGMPGQPGAYRAGESVMQTFVLVRGYIPGGIDKVITGRDFKVSGRCHQIVIGPEKVSCNELQMNDNRTRERENMVQRFDARAWRI